MKKILATIFAWALLFVLCSCSMDLQLDDYFGFSKQNFTVVEETDTHGGFLGDGLYYLILDCSENEEAALNIVAEWKQLPLSENLNLMIYGGAKDGTIYGYGLSEEAHIPAIENGYYYFVDRHTKANDASDDSGLFSRFSFNFSLAVYDSDTNRFYYLEFDT